MAPLHTRGRPLVRVNDMSCQKQGRAGNPRDGDRLMGAPLARDVGAARHSAGGSLTSGVASTGRNRRDATSADCEPFGRQNVSYRHQLALERLTLRPRNLDRRARDGRWRPTGASHLQRSRRTWYGPVASLSVHPETGSAGAPAGDAALRYSACSAMMRLPGCGARAMSRLSRCWMVLLVGPLLRPQCDDASS